MEINKKNEKLMKRFCLSLRKGSCIFVRSFPMKQQRINKCKILWKKQKQLAERILFRIIDDGRQGQL